MMCFHFNTWMHEALDLLYKLHYYFLLGIFLVRILKEIFLYLKIKVGLVVGLYYFHVKSKIPNEDYKTWYLSSEYDTIL